MKKGSGCGKFKSAEPKNIMLVVVCSVMSPNFAVMNPNASDATVTVTAYGSDGTVITSESTTIPAGLIMTGPVDSMIGGVILFFRRLCADCC